MRIHRWAQTWLGSGWLAGLILAGGCGERDTYTVVKIDRGGLQIDAQSLCIDATVGTLSARQCYKNLPGEVAFWLPFGTLHFDAEQGQWVGETVIVKADALNASACVLASGMASQKATHQTRLDLTVTLLPQGGCTP